jgi:hypothetical protein
MVLSLHFYDEEQYAVGAKEPRRGMGSVVRFARSMHMFATVVLCANIQCELLTHETIAGPAQYDDV